MIRKIIEIDEEKCNGCGACADACHEGAIGMVNGKARLLRDDYCDGLGDCLPSCPADAISFVEREALAYDEAAVMANMEKKKAAEKIAAENSSDCCSCSGSGMVPGPSACSCGSESDEPFAPVKSRLNQWPVQIKLLPVESPIFDNADILIAADCTAYAYGDFHRKFMTDKITIIGCPKLDAFDYSEKLTEIFRRNNVRSIVLTRMQVPCCGGMEYAIKQAIMNCGKNIPLEVFTISSDGDIL